MKIFIILTTISLCLYSCDHLCKCPDKSINISNNYQQTDIDSSVVLKKDSIKEFFTTFFSDTVFENAIYAYKIIDAENDSVIAQFNSNITLIPASTIKILTTAAALDILGPKTTFKTYLQYDGKIENGILNGNVIIKGGGDPSFGIGIENKEKFFKPWVNKIKSLNIDSITGYIIGDGKIFDKDIIPYTWSWGEINLDYCAAASGLSIYGNIFELGFVPERKGILKPDSKNMFPFVPNLIFDINTIRGVVEEEDLYQIGHPYGNKFYIKGVVPIKKKEAVHIGTINNPPFVVANEFFNALSKEGIKCGRGPISLADDDSLDNVLKKAEKKTVGIINSPDVATFVITTNMISYNFYAEALLKHCGLKQYGYGSTESGAKAIYEYWKNKGVNTKGLYIYDGSGISRYNGITVSQLTDVLKIMRKEKYFDIFFKSLSVVGKRGTLRAMCLKTPAEGRIFAKSGTMSRVRSYAGYIKTLNGKELIFAIIYNNFTCPTYYIKEKTEVLFNYLVRL